MDYLSIAREIVLKHIDIQNYNVFLFGSRAVGNVSKFSDLCIVDFFYVDEAFKNMALKKIIEWN